MFCCDCRVIAILYCQEAFNLTQRKALAAFYSTAIIAPKTSTPTYKLRTFQRESVASMDILDLHIKSTITDRILHPIQHGDFNSAIINLPSILDKLYTNIPDQRRSSFGRVYTIKVLSKYLYRQFMDAQLPVYDVASRIFELCSETRSKGVALGILSYYGLEAYQRVLSYFELTAAGENWEIREFAQMFFRKLTQKYPMEIKSFLCELAKSDNPNHRRFVAETLRPVQENQWIYRKPEYSLSILRLLFREPLAYPRTSVGNNLSDLARRLPELVITLVNELVSNGDTNSYWIAYRACRNLVKKEPLTVMDSLGVDEYRYKKRIYKRSDFI